MSSISHELFIRFDPILNLHNMVKYIRLACIYRYSVMRLYLFVWPKSLLIVNYIIKSLYSMVKINLEYFHCITYDSIFVV